MLALKLTLVFVGITVMFGIFSALFHFLEQR